MPANSPLPAHRLPPVQGTLALEMPSPGLPAMRPDLRLITSEPAAPQGVGVPAPEPWAARFVQAVVEVVAGDRPVQQLVRWTDEAVYADLRRRVRVLGETSNADVRVRTERCQLRSVHVCQPAPDVAEVAAHVRHGGRSRAIAVRLEAERGRWMCTALQFG